MKIYYLGVNLKYIKTVSRYHAFKDFAKEEITSRLIFEACNSADVVEDDILVQWLTLNYAMKDKNPVDSVLFFTKYDKNKTVLLC